MSKIAMSKSKSPFETISKILYRKNINPKDFEQFKNSLMALYNYAKDHASESEEHHKNVLSNFLKNNFYQDYEINTHKRIDLAIAKQNSNIEVLIESKSPSNTLEMISKSDINKKAMQEAVLYFMRERFKSDGLANNIHIKHIIITNNIDFFIFDAHLFDKYFAQNSQFKKEFLAFENGQTSDDRTKAFYNDIAKKQIDAVKENLEFCYFSSNIALGTDAELSENELIAIYKLLSADHLLKLPFANDANSLNKEFYNELLYILGLTESKESGKLIITRFQEGKRQSASLIENTIRQIKSNEKLSSLNNLKEYGENENEQLFSIALELVISWLNRILFLKLLESNLLKYNNGDSAYKFLTFDKIQEYDDLNELFFEVLAKRINDRDELGEKYKLIPYLNSSLFEPTNLEREIFSISSLKDKGNILYYSATVLKQVDEKKQSGEIKTLEYLLKFLDAYDFGSTSKNIISEKSKTIINASVLGLIFEKINGYKDGSFYTPGYITMYMCRESIRAAVLQKFNEFYSENSAASLNNESKNTAKNSNKKGKNLKGNKSSDDNKDEQDYKFKTFEGLKNYILDHHEPSDLKKFNEIINSLKICDPAVGSGHFLVSALNEIISIKSELKILTDSDGNRLQISIDIENDELIINDLVHKGIYIYNPLNSENAKVQKTLFYEKQNIIENCLFGVDINPKSVMICRLRLWIELLKNAYYKGSANGKELETLPNIDINIKCGNSLISRYGLYSNLHSSPEMIKDYKNNVNIYKNTISKKIKQEVDLKIKNTKQIFKSNIVEISELNYKLESLNFNYSKKNPQKESLFLSDSKIAIRENKMKKEIDALKIKIKKVEYERMVLFYNSIEWRFDFPEILDSNGNFIGFDLVIGNPPYINSKGDSFSKILKIYFYEIYKTASYQIDTYLLFIELAKKITKVNSQFTYIIPNAWINNLFLKDIRKFVFSNFFINKIINAPIGVFPGVTVDTVILWGSNKIERNTNFEVSEVKDENIVKIHNKNQNIFFENENFFQNLFSTSKQDTLIQKFEYNSIPLIQICKMSSGIKEYETGKGVPKQTKEDKIKKIFNSNKKINNSYLKHIKGVDVNRYFINWKGEYLSYGEWIAAPRDPIFFQNERIIIREIPNKKNLVVAYCNEEYTVKNSAHIAIVINLQFETKYIVAILNSNVIGFYFKHKFGEYDSVFPKAKIGQCKQLPIPQISEKEQKPFVNLVDIILAKKEKGEDTSNEEKEIDQMVYKLYELTDEEIEIVEKG